MEGLIELVAASFLRHGLESPAADAKTVAAQSAAPGPTHGASAIEPAAFPEHSFRKKPEADFAL